MGCGTALAATCPACQQANPPGAHFCIACGTALTAPGQRDVGPSAVPKLPPTPEANAAATEAELEGERKQVTVLFADVVGSTALIQDRDEEEAHRLLTGALRVMMDAVHQFGGTVSRNMGDGLLALFGAPIAHEDHAVRACYAALAIQDRMSAYSDRVSTELGADVQVRVGLNSGGVVVQLLSDDKHSDYSAMGRTVHLAARMEQSAAPGTIRLTAETLGLVEGRVEARALGAEAVRGLADPVEVFELLGADAGRTRLQIAASRGLTRFVGRQAETEVLRAALERAQAGQGQIAALVGEPGVGKSRLVWEMTRGQASDDTESGGLPAGWLVLASGALSYGTTTSYLPVVSLIKEWGGIVPSDDPAAVDAKLTARLLALDAALESARPALLALLDVPVEDAGWQTLDPPRRRRRTIDAVKRLLLRQSQDRPLLLVFEDLHWLDAESQALLDELVESLPAARMLLLVTYRPEYRHAWGSKGSYTQLRIDTLAPASAEELLASLLGQDTGLEPLKRHLVTHTDGNPFFLEESVRSLVETGAVVGERGAQRLIRAVPELRMPATVQAVLAARIDRLTTADKRLLQTAAVVGKDVPLVLVQAVAGLSDEALQAGLSRLRDAELLYEVRLFPEAEYTFKHALTHEVAYGSLLLERRRGLHARIVEAVEQRYPDRLDEQVERLAHHALHGEVWEKALVYSRQAGRKALARSALREAAEGIDRALAALRHLPESPTTLEQAIDLSIDLRGALNQLGELARAFGLLEQAERHAERLGDRRRLARVSVSMNSYHYMTGNAGAGLIVARRALTLGEELDDLTVQGAAHHCLGQDRHARGEFRRAVDHFTRALECMVRTHGERRDLLGSTTPLAQHTRSCLAWSLAELGEVDEARTIAQDAIRVAEELGHSLSIMTALEYFGIVCMRTGRVLEATAPLQRALDLLAGANLQTGIGFNGMAGPLGEAFVTMGRAADALPLLERVRMQSLAQGVVSDYFLGGIPLSEAYLLAGRHAEALNIAEEAEGLARQHGERGSQARALRVLAEVQAHPESGSSSAAEGTFRQALALAEELEMRPLQARCRLGLGTLLHRIGRLDEAHAELRQAVDLLREMEMAYWLPGAEAALAAASSA